MADVQKSKKDLSPLLKEWKAMQEGIDDKINTLDSAVPKVLRISKKEGKKAVGEEGAYLLEKYRMELGILFMQRLNSDETDALFKKGMSLLNEGGFDPSMKAPMHVVLTGGEYDYRNERAHKAAKRISESKEHGDEDKAIAELFANEMRINMMAGIFSVIRRGPGGSRFKWNEERDAGKREEIKRILRGPGPEEKETDQ